MNFAILGETSDTAAIAEALSASAQHSVTHIACVSDESSLVGTFPAARRTSEWEDLLADASIEAVLVSGHEEEVLPPSRKIASTGRLLVVVPSKGLTSGFAYELSLVRDENLVPLFPVLAHRLDPAAVKAKETIESGGLGSIVQLRFERQVPTADHLLQPQRDVEPWLMPDADLLRWFGGAFTQVTALYQGKTETGFANATITLAGDSATDSSWFLSTTAEPNWKLTASGTDGQLSLENKNGATSLTVNGQASTLSNGKTETNATDWLQSLPDAITTFTSEKTSQAQRSAVWTDFTRSHEIVDSHRRSIKRRRTIDMHFETLSERSQFKTQMAAMGCGVLTYTLFGLVFYLVIAGAFAPPTGAPEAQVSRYSLLCKIGFAAWILPLMVFLGFQLLLGITKPPANPTDTDTAEPTS